MPKQSGKLQNPKENKKDIVTLNAVLLYTLVTWKELYFLPINLLLRESEWKGDGTLNFLEI